MAQVPIVDCLQGIERWQIRWVFLPHFPLEGDRFDLCITTYPNAQLRELRHHLPHCPIVVINDQAVLVTPGIEVIPPDQLSPLTLELSIRLLLCQKQDDDHPQLISPWQHDRPFQTLFERMGEVIILLTPDFKIAAWNRAAEEIYGYTQAMVLGEDYNLLFSPPGDRQSFIRDFRQALEGKVISSRDHLIVGRDGSLHRLNWSLIRYQGDRDEVLGVICCGRELPLEVTKPLLHSAVNPPLCEIFDQIAMGVAWISAEGYILDCNSIFADFLGYERDLLKGSHCVDLFDPQEAAISLEVIADILHGQRTTFRCEQPYLTPQGDRRWLETTFTAAHNPDQHTPLILLLVLDVTERPPSAHDLRTHLQLTTTLVQFSQALLRPQSNLQEALGIFGQQLRVQRVCLLQWNFKGNTPRRRSPTLLEQWAAPEISPTADLFAKLPLAWWQFFLKLGEIIDIHHRDHYPELAPELARLGVVSLLAVPILDSSGHLWGHLMLMGDRPTATSHAPFTIQTLKLAAELIHHNHMRLLTQRELEASEALYSGIVTHSAEALFLMDVTTTNTFLFAMVNPTYCEKLQVDPKRMIGKSPQQVFPTKLAQQMQEAFYGCLQIGETLLFEEVLELQENTQIWRTCLIPIRDRQGKIVRIQGSGRDVTEERQLELLKMRYSRHQHLLASLTVKILQSWELDTMLTTTVQELRKTLQADRVIFWERLNDTEGKVTTAAAIANIESMQDVILSVAAFDRGDFEQFYQGEIQTCIDIETAQFPPAHDDMLRQYQVLSYAVLPVLVTSTDDPEGEPYLKGLICVHQCHVTKPWSTDEIRLLRQLTNQICIALNQAELLHRQRHYTEELARSNKELEQFAYIASHDLQEPLQIVSNYAQLLQKRNQTTLDDRSRRYIHHIVEGTQQMQTQIQDLLRYSRLNTRLSPFTPMPLQDCLDRAIANLQIKIKQAQAKLTYPDTLPIIFGDASQLHSLWQNLLGNAIKYRGDRPLEIQISYQKIGNYWQFVIQDNGIGIDPQYKERIFQIFQRLHTQEEYPGTGIGLAICQRIIKLHGGKIWVESKLGEGAAFCFTLPIYKSP